MKQTIDKSAFRDAFHRMGRGDQFSYEALGMIFDHLTELEEDSGVETELDPIAVCCEFAEYADVDELREAYPHLDLPPDDDDKALSAFIDSPGGAILIGKGGSPIVVNSC